MKLNILIITIIGLLAASSAAELPKLLVNEKFNSGDLIDAANHYHKKGQREAVLELVSLAWRPVDNQPPFSMKERVCWILSMLFQPTDMSNKDSMYLRGLSVPPIENKFLVCYMYPIVSVDGHYFVMAEGMSGTGGEFSVFHYVDRCLKYGSFIKTPIETPKKEISEQELTEYFKRKEWIGMFDMTDKTAKIKLETVEKFMLKQLQK